MNLKEVKDLVREILRSDISEFELEHTGTRLRLRRGATPSSADPRVEIEVAATAPQIGETPTEAAAGIARPEAEGSEESSDAGLHPVTSPIVGTFYRAPSPGAEPYVKVGDVVEEGTILCVIEAMKLMNEIPSDTSGEVVRVYVENSHPVEFGQKLFGIRPRK